MSRAKPLAPSVPTAANCAAVVYQIVLTKTDKLKPSEAQKRLEETQAKVARRPAAFPVISATSSAKRDGLDELRGEISTLALPAGE